ncbi:Nucleotide-binding alpha-beta plait domain-containing protein [Dioscorea alata]|uniref:Nucleotide-binding alpha-beta plait domain-containing protein n=1 Tax=Dioscorea alata TaxID=55571 RepID=A0ACB7W188_DIOAL|nr:Nucleotide-binding alpha-beta plait domain-containing protein [Dioscorea alata]
MTIEEITNNCRFGDVESVSVQTVTKPGAEPLFARVSFWHEETMLRVLNGNEKAKFIFKGKHLWARRFTTI